MSPYDLSKTHYNFLELCVRRVLKHSALYPHNIN